MMNVYSTKLINFFVSVMSMMCVLCDKALFNLPIQRVSSKEWFSYCEKLIEDLVSRTTKVSPMKHTLKDSVTKVWSFHQLFFTRTGDITCCKRFSGQTEVKRFSGQTEVKRVSGLIRHTEDKLLDYFDVYRLFSKKSYMRESKGDYHKKKWMFLLNFSLRLNLSFEQIYFSYNSQECSFGKVEVSSYLQNKSVQNLTLCGQYPLVHVYTESSCVDVVLKLPPRDPLFSVVHFRFSVMDCDIVFSRSPCSFSENVTQFSLYEFPPQQTWIYVYQLRVKQYQKISVALNRTNYPHATFYNGPGFDSPILNLQSALITASSFQCLLRFYTSHSFSLGVQFSPTQTQNDPQFDVKMKNTSFNKDLLFHGTSLHKAFSLSAVPGLYVNVSVGKLVYKGPHSDACIFGGFVLHDQIFSESIKAYSLCQNNNYLKRIPRQNMYSTNTTFIAVVYSYPEYSWIHLKIHVSNTKCPAVPIDLCLVKRLCFPDSSAKTCKRYFMSITYNTNVSLELLSGPLAKVKYSKLPFKVGSTHGIIYFKLNINSCATIQISRNKTDSSLSTTLHYNKDCSYYILPQQNQTGSAFIVYQMSLFLAKISRQPQLLDALKIDGQDEMNMSEPPYIQTVIQRHSVVVSCSLVSQLPVHSKTLKFKVDQNYWSLSWIDILVWWNVTHINERLCRSVSFHNNMYQVDSHSGKVPIAETPKVVLVLVLLQHKVTVSIRVCIESQVHLKTHRANSKDHFRRETALHQIDHLVFDSTNTKHLFSVQGRFTQVNLAQTEAKLSVFWLNDVYKQYHNDIYSVEQNCTPFQQRIQTDKHHCLTLKIAQKHLPHFDFLVIGNTELKGHLWSWKQASNICEQMQSQLPQFYSKKELQVFLAFFKSTSDILQREAIFVGNTLIKVVSQSFPETRDRTVCSESWFHLLFLFQAKRKQNPVAYQLWSNALFKKPTVVHFKYRSHNAAARALATILKMTGKRHNWFEKEDLSSPLYLAKCQSKQQLMPVMHSNNSCTMMVISNLVTPVWISVHCSQKFSVDVFCRQLLRKENINLQKTRGCLKHFIFNGSKCFYFPLWEEKTFIGATKLCLNHTMWLHNLPSITEFEYLFQAVSTQFLPFVYFTSQLLPVMYNYKLILGSFEYSSFQNKYISDGSIGGLIRCAMEPSWVLNTGNMYKCSDGVFISAELLCDGTVDCASSSHNDEMFCSCSNEQARSNQQLFQCKYLQDGNKSSCSSLYYATADNNCIKYEEFLGNSVARKYEMFQCQNKVEIHEELVNDLVSDCGAQSEDEQNFINLLTKGETLSCRKPEQLACRTGLSRCYDISDVCVYRLNKFSHLYPCRTGGHVQECRDFLCNKMFKCPHHYCIPFSYVCNGKWDCPEGHEEQACGQYKYCSGLLKCKNSQICAHPDDRCDSFTDCPLGEDELMCDLIYIQCPHVCSCLLYALSCSNVSADFNNLNLLNYVYHSVFMFNCTNVSFHYLLSKLANVLFLQLPGNKLKEICPMMGLYKLISLDVGSNRVKSISSKCLTSYKLVKIDFSSNKLTTLEPKAFCNLQKLLFLNLSNNYLTTLNASTFSFSRSMYLAVLSVQDNSFTFISKEIFDNTNVRVVQTNDYRVCCMAPKCIQCEATRLSFQSCKTLLVNLPIQASFVVISILIYLCNTVSMVQQRRNKMNSSKRSKNEFRMIIISINFCDILCGVYLSILWTADIAFGEDFLFKELQWRSSVTCFSAFGVCFLFGLLSPALLCFMSLSRLMVVKYPIDTRFKCSHFVHRCILLILTVVNCVTIAFVLTSYFIMRTVPVSFCSAFVDVNGEMVVIKLSTFAVTISQTAAIVFISVTYILLVLGLSKSQNSTAACTNRKKNNFGLIFQLVFVTSTNFLCWIPGGAIHLVSLFKSQYPIMLVVSATVALMPLNSVVNPVAFIWSTIRSEG